MGEIKTTVYEIRFRDGRTATMLSMSGDNLEKATRSVQDRFGADRVIEVVAK